MPKRSRTAKPTKPVRKPAARLVTKAHQQERRENEIALRPRDLTALHATRTKARSRTKTR